MKNELLALDAAAATITTATVNIRVLRVGTKQLTQAIFKQLPIRGLIDYQRIAIVGTVWGWVNYDTRERYFEVVWYVAQFGDTLYRCPVRFNMPHKDNDGQWWVPTNYANQVKASEEAAESWKGLYYRLEKAPQLFIAV